MSDSENPYRAPGAALIDEPREVGGSIDNTLAGNADLDVEGVMREAWDRVSGIKGIVLAGSFTVLLVSFVATAVLNVVLSPQLTQLVVTIAMYPIFAGIFMVGLRQSVGLPVDFSEPFNHFDRIVPIAAVGVLASLATAVGMVFLVLPGLYLGIALSLSIPLVVDKELSIVDALTTSLKLINQKFFTVLVLLVLAGLVLIAATFTIVGLVWALPWVVMVYAITYRQLAGASISG